MIGSVCVRTLMSGRHYISEGIKYGFILLAGCSLDATPSESTLTTSDVDGATQNLDTSVPDLAGILDASVRSGDVGATLLDAAAPKDGSGLDSADAI